MTEDLRDLAAKLTATYKAEREKLDRFMKAGISSGEAKNIQLVARMAEDLGRVLRTRQGESKEDALGLAGDFVALGAKAVLLTGSQRGGDFLNSQLRGRWAERVVLNMSVDGLVFAAFGPSGAAMPGEEDHRKTVMTFREIMLLEGKRPDLLAFDKTVWGTLPKVAQGRCRSWPDRVLDAGDLSIVKTGRCGIEVKNSTWHYGARRKAGGGPLSITVKEEEIEDITGWENQSGLPVLFFQVLFDEVYCMSFRRMLKGVRDGRVYKAGDYELDKSTGADGKVFHRFHLDNLDHRCAKVRLPDESIAHVRVLPDGNVIPYIDFQPAEAHEVVRDVISRELDYAAR